MAIYYKEMAKELAKRKATITITDNGQVVKRKAVGTFASKAGRASYWGVILDEPIDDGSCNGVTCNCIIDFSFDEEKRDLTPNQKVIEEMIVRFKNKGMSVDEIATKLNKRGYNISASSVFIISKKANDNAADFMGKLSEALQSVVDQVQHS